jgi:membrane protein required for colicin V production
MDLSLLDGFILVAVAGGLVRGLMLGAVRQVTSLVGVLVAFVAAVQWMRPLGTLLQDVTSLSDDMAALVAFVALFAGIQIVVSILTRLVESMLEVLALGLVNRVAGGLLGAFKSALLLSVLFLVLAAVELPDDQAREDSQFYTYVAPLLPQTWNAAADTFPNLRRLSDRFGQRIQEHLDGRDLPSIET